MDVSTKWLDQWHLIPAKKYNTRVFKDNKIIFKEKPEKTNDRIPELKISLADSG